MACSVACQPRPSAMELANWIKAWGAWAWHCATTSRAHPSHWPHCVATPSSIWIWSKSNPARAWRAISRSLTRRHTQTIMGWLGKIEVDLIINKNPSHLQPLCQHTPTDLPQPAGSQQRSCCVRRIRPSGFANNFAGPLCQSGRSAFPGSQCAPRCRPECPATGRARRSRGRSQQRQCRS